MKSKWISIKDRLPEERQNTLAITNYGEMCAMRYVDKEFIRITTCRRCSGMSLGGLTHWQPLPKAPKVIKDN